MIHNFDAHIELTRADSKPIVIEDVRFMRISPKYATIHFWVGDEEDQRFIPVLPIKNLTFKRQIGGDDDDCKP